MASACPGIGEARGSSIQLPCPLCKLVRGTRGAGATSLYPKVQHEATISWKQNRSLSPNPMFHLSNQLSHSDKSFAFGSFSAPWPCRCKILFRKKIILYIFWCFFTSLYAFRTPAFSGSSKNGECHGNLNTKQHINTGVTYLFPFLLFFFFFTIISFENLSVSPCTLLFENLLTPQLWNMTAL